MNPFIAFFGNLLGVISAIRETYVEWKKEAKEAKRDKASYETGVSVADSRRVRSNWDSAKRRVAKRKRDAQK